MTFFTGKHLAVQSNKLLPYSPILAVVCALILTFAASAKAQETSYEYHGFKIDYAQVTAVQNKAAVLKSVEKQIEIVEGVRLSAGNLAFFKTIPIVITPDAPGTPGNYDGINSRVLLKGRLLDGDKPILLHEFLHGYQFKKLVGTAQNNELRAFSQAALSLYPNFKGEYFLSNPREYFAVTASIYLFGSIPRPPFDQSTIKTTQPKYYQFLDGLFGGENAK